MNELWLLIWTVGRQFCPDSGAYPLCKKFAEASEYKVCVSSSAAIEYYDSLVEINNKKEIDYRLFRIEAEWLIIPKKKDYLYDLKLLKRK